MNQQYSASMRTQIRILFRHVYQIMFFIFLGSQVALAQSLCPMLFLTVAKEVKPFTQEEIEGLEPMEAFSTLPMFQRYLLTMEGEYNQSRTLSRIIYEVPGFGDFIFDSLPGSMIVDLGAGYGITVASATYGRTLIPENLITRMSMFNNYHIEQLKDVRFLGITAVDAARMQVPLVDPNGRYEILTGQLFENIPDKELKNRIGSKPVRAFSIEGILEYTPRPDLALEKIHNVFPVGSQIAVGHSSLFKTKTGEFLELPEFAEMCGGFKLTKLSDILWSLEVTNEAYKRKSLKIIGTRGTIIPPGYIFEILD